MADKVRGVLVGYDGSPGGDLALTWAVREARSRGTVLTVVHAWETCDAAPGDEAVAAALARRAGKQVLAEGTRFARSISDVENVRSLLVEGQTAAMLCQHSTDAELTVMGARGRGRFAAPRLGAVSAEVAARADGPVVVVRGHWRPAGGYIPGPVVVGADGSAASRAAVAFALQEATLRQASLLVVVALADAAETLGGAHRLKEEFGQSIDQWQHEYAAVDIERSVADGSPRAALLDATHAAQLVVVGARGRGGVPGMSLGSVSHALLRHAHCPVAVVHPR